MTVVLTTKYLEMRARLQPSQSAAEDTRLVEESVEPDWIREADQISDELGSLKDAITSLEQKQVQKRQATFQDALNEEILVLRQRLVGRLQAAGQRIGRYERGSPSPADAEEKLFRGFVVRALKAQLGARTQDFRTLQSRFLNAVVQERSANAEKTHFSAEA